MQPRQQSPTPSQPTRMQDRDDDAQYERELREAIALTSRGQFDAAIPRFLKARPALGGNFALEFNLALCYVGTRRFDEAARVLSALPAKRVNVLNLRAQSYIGLHQFDRAADIFREAVQLEPTNERLYLQLAQACLDESAFDLARLVLDTGIKNVARSARLRFERGVLNVEQDDNEAAKLDFAAVRELAPNSEIADIAAAEQAFVSGDLSEAVRAARAGVRAGRTHYLLLTMLGEALLRAGAAPDSSEFAEARAALEQSVATQPRYPSSRVALGRVYLSLNKVDEAIAQLEAARDLAPRSPAAYAPLAAAYRRARQPDKAKQTLAALAELNRLEAERIGSAEGGHAGYMSGRPKQ